MNTEVEGTRSAAEDPMSRAIIMVGDRPDFIDALAAGELLKAAQAVKASGWAGLLAASITMPRLARDAYASSRSVSWRERSEAELLEMLSSDLKLGMPIQGIDVTSAMSRFSFDAGHIPKAGELYIQHPLDINRYIAADFYGETIFAERQLAFQKLAAALGAKRIRLTSVRSNGAKRGGGLKLPIEKLGASIGLSVRADESGSVSETTVAEFGRPKRLEAFVPEELRKWVEADGQLKAMVFNRTEANVLKSTVTLEFANSYGAAGELTARMKGEEVAASAHYEKLAKTVWSFEVEYFDFDSVAPLA